MTISNLIDYNLKFRMLKFILKNFFNEKLIEYAVNPSPTLIFANAFNHLKCCHTLSTSFEERDEIVQSS